MQSSSRKSGLLLWRVLAQSRACWPQLTGIFFLSILSLPLTLLYPLPLKIAVDSVLGHQSLPAGLHLLSNAGGRLGLLGLALFLLLSIAVLVNLQALASWWLQTYTGEKLAWDFRAQLLNHVQRLPLMFHDRYGASDCVYRIQHDAPAIQYVVVQGLIPLLTAITTLTGMIYVTGRIDRSLAGVSIAIAPILLLLSAVCSRLVRRRSLEVRALDSSAMSVIQEVLGSIRVIKAFGQETREHERFIRRSHDRISGQLHLAVRQAFFNVLTGLTIAGGTAATLYIGIQHVRAGTLTVGSLLVVMAYVAQIYQPLQLLSTKTIELQAWFSSLERAFVILDQKPEISESPKAIPLVRAKGEFVFQDVSFQYEGARSGLNGLSFRITPGSRVGIVGTTGAGKTTLLNLLMRFYDPSEGQVLLDGVDLREYRIADLRRQFAVVLQEPVLFAASIAENIAYGKRDASDAEITASAQAASAHDFISALPQGYETSAGERGTRLSGGERQRISLARAFLRDSPILILDEPTSSVDVHTEAAIMNATEHLMENRTTFMIAHRVETLKNCDVILELNQGRLMRIHKRAPQLWSLAAGT
ncbi:MAG: ABC transporter ATP-binding protein [Acidobacteria bacterium]|nr:MAG: ABC transporter ATP-binding protein [Acidobacteriota bacterium]PYV88388.1 MAG: ABC transporter ATP-binding protein [Acidobacteriota bacterium]